MTTSASSSKWSSSFITKNLPSLSSLFAIVPQSESQLDLGMHSWLYRLQSVFTMAVSRAVLLAIFISLHWYVAVPDPSSASFQLVSLSMYSFRCPFLNFPSVFCSFVGGVGRKTGTCTASIIYFALNTTWTSTSMPSLPSIIIPAIIHCHR